MLDRGFLNHQQLWNSEAGPLQTAARTSAEVAERWASLLTEGDRAALMAGFHLAETMAGFAVEQALEQLPEAYADGLRAQARDEARHVEIFARWLGDAPNISMPQIRQRQTFQWLVLLLVNELTGFCQFSMLARLLHTSEGRAVVEGIIEDERRHILRLLTWMEPLWGTKTAVPVFEFIRRFRKDLPGRMGQFFPRDELAPLRVELTHVVDTLLDRLPAMSDVRQDG